MRKLLNKVSGVAIATAFLLGSTASWADPITVNNWSFEDDIMSPSGNYAYSASGWTLSGGGAGTWYPEPTSAIPGNAPIDLCDDAGTPDDPLGGFMAGVTGTQVGFSQGGDFSQLTGATITPGYRYTLTADVGGRCDFPTQNFAFMFTAGTAMGTTGTISSLQGGWVRESAVYDSPLGDPNYTLAITIKLEDIGGSQVAFDRVLFTEAQILTCEGFFTPFDEPLAFKRKSKRAIPVKMVLLDVDDNEIKDGDIAPPVVQVVKGDDTGLDIPGSDGDLLPPGLSDDGNEFRYDPIDMQWIINLATKQYTASGVYTVSVVAGDGSYVVDGCSQTFTRP